jgi:hypothetical protein
VYALHKDGTDMPKHVAVVKDYIDVFAISFGIPAYKLYFLAKCTEWIITKYRNTVFTDHCASRTLEGGASLCHTFALYYFK